MKANEPGGAVARTGSIKSIFGLLFLAVLVNACGKKVTSGTTELASRCGIANEKPRTSGLDQKVHVARVNREGVISKSSADIAAGFIDVRVDVKCVANHPHLQNFLGIDLLAENALGQKNYFTFSMDAEGLDLQVLRESTEANPCIVGVADSGIIRKADFTTSSANDSLLAQQDHLTALRYDNAYYYFFEQQNIDSGVEVIVAVVDTGIEYTHPDLSCNMWGGLGIDIANGDNDPMDDDVQGHGTHVAGIIGACANNGIGGLGVMGRNIKLMAIKSLDADGAGDVSWVTQGIDWAVDNGAKVVNLSLEAPGRFPLLREAIQRAVNAGVVVVGAAGNGNQEITAANPVSPGIDADIPGMIAVASVDSLTLGRSTFSNYSSTYIEIAAPGARDSRNLTGIYSTQIGGGYTRIAGTSQAAPVVAGAIGLMIGFLESRQISYTPATIEGYLSFNGTSTSASLMGRVEYGAVLNFRNLSNNLASHYGNVTNSSFQICP